VGLAEEERARQVLHLVDVDPQRAWAQALPLLAEAVRGADHASAAVVGRAAGLAAMHVADLDTAARLLVDAVLAARRAGRPELAGEARMSLAFVLTRRGETRRALRMIDQAVAGLSGLPRARAVAQRAFIRHQLGRLDEALIDYAAALPALRAAQEWTWVQKIHSNRAVLYIYRSQLKAAEADLAAGEMICRAHGLDSLLGFLYDNLGFLHVRRGDVPAALAALDEAERRHRAVGARLGTILVDRAELLLTVRLTAEALDAATRAVDDFRANARGIALPQAQLLVADAALLDGDAATARAAADEALWSFRAQGRREWVALARYTVLRCRLAQDRAPRVTARELARAGAALHDAGWTVPALDAKLRAARRYLEAGRQDAADELARQVRRAGRGPVELRARAWHAEALGRMAQGRNMAADRALIAGVRLLEEHQATLGSLDLRTAMSGHREALVRAGMRLALDSGRPRRVFAWAERGRAAALLTRPVRPPQDPVLADMLAELRNVVAADDDARAAGGPPTALMRRRLALERGVRDRVRTIRNSATVVRRATVPEVQDALGDACLVEYIEHAGELAAVVVTASRVGLVALGPVGDVSRTVDHVPLTLQRLTRRTTAAAPPEHALALLRALGQRLDARLLTPLRRFIGDRVLVVVPTGPLRAVPWSVLPSCRGRSVTVAPSASLWLRSVLAPALSPSVLAAAGPRLSDARFEVEAVAALYPTSRSLVGDDASVAAVRAGMGEASIAHLAAHGRFRDDNPLFSALWFADGPLTLYDLESLPRVPHLVLMAACDAGSSATRPGGELLGLAAGLLTLGTATLIAAHGPIHDGATADLMVDLHRRLRSGLVPAAALAMVQTRAADAEPRVRAAAASLVCLGAGISPVMPAQ
jgi:tetratricopeptide (TPR) repeat protein